MGPVERERRRKRILETYRECGSIKETRRRLGHSIGLIRKVLRGEDHPRFRTRASSRGSKLDPYKPMIKRLVLEDEFSAVLVLEEIRKIGYDGGYSNLCHYIQGIRPKSGKRPTTVLEHPPGVEGQVDWSPYSVSLGGQRCIVHAFSLVLPFSRWMCVRFAMDEKLDTLIRLHEEAFSLLGAVPHRMTYDNMTTVGRHVSKDKVWLNPRFEAWAEPYDFAIHLIDPGSPNQHGSVERPFDYVENNCLRRKRFRFDDLEALNQHATWWCDEVANVRTHGSTRERPIDRLLRERPFLKALPGIRPEPFRTLYRTVRSDFCVAVDTNGYSVPPRYVDRQATVRAYSDRLEVLVEGSIVAVHSICPGRHQRMVLPEHEADFKRSTSSARLLEQAFLRLGPSAENYYMGLKAQRGRGAGYHLKRLLTMADRHGSEVVTGAMAHAARYGNYNADAVARVIAGKTHRNATTPRHDVPMPPERVRRWLEGLEVEGRDLADYDEMIGQIEHQGEECDDEQG